MSFFHEVKTRGLLCYFIVMVSQSRRQLYCGKPLGVADYANDCLDRHHLRELLQDFWETEA